MIKSAAGPRIAIIAADFHQDIAEVMIKAAEDTLKSEGARLLPTVRVPGAYEIPLQAELLLAKRKVDALVVVGFIERGETLHGEVMGHVVHANLIDIQRKYRKPIGIGLIGPGATVEQAHVRKEAAARGAAAAVVKAHALVRS
ncbi:MAG: 6,7-dimethyl-8-ribityllumazine synthase [Candidatus Andersenbacteria bacterium]